MKDLFNACPCLYISTPSNLFYFSGYKNSDAVIIVLNGKKYYFTDARYFEEVSSLIDFSIEDSKNINEFLQENGIKQVFFDHSITLNDYTNFQKIGITKAENVAEKISEYREIKTEKELWNINKAQKITDKTFINLLDKFQEGITEIDVSRQLKSLLYLNGADGLSFEPIVAFGENTSKPHAHPTEKKLQKGMLITLDFGAEYHNYCSDMTRTIAFGKIPQKQIDTYYIVLEAQENALKNLCAEKSGCECHNYALETFKKYGQEEYFTHSLGHGIGIDIHESPYLSPRFDRIIRENSVTSVEPGLYYTGKYGVRIEDMVVFTKNGIKNLTNSEKKLIIL